MTLEPFEVLFEETGLPGAGLPAALTEIYGGDLGFEEPSVFANFVATVDGVVAIPTQRGSNELVSGGSKADHFVMGLLRALADVVLIGAGVLEDSPRGTWRPEKVYPPAAEAFAELRRSSGRTPAPEVAVLTGLGSVDPGHPLFGTGALVLTGEKGAARLTELPRASTLVTLGEETRFDGRTVVDALHQRGHRLILSEAGPHVFGSLLEAGVVDELFLTSSPLLAGEGEDGSRLRLVEAAGFVPLLELRPLSLRRHGGHLFTRYAVRERAGARPRGAGSDR
jgi:riboflavin biosynthesis pyrimidine reductase